MTRRVIDLSASRAKDVEQSTRKLKSTMSSRKPVTWRLALTWALPSMESVPHNRYQTLGRRAFLNHTQISGVRERTHLARIALGRFRDQEQRIIFKTAVVTVIHQAGDVPQGLNQQPGAVLAQPLGKVTIFRGCTFLSSPCSRKPSNACRDRNRD